MIDIKDKKLCCGCNACVSVCPKGCIHMKEDEEGFLYPVVDEKNCIHCGLCTKTCPILNQKKRGGKPFAYGAHNKNEEELMNSSSGGIFPLLARHILRQGGVVFGAIFNENFEVVHGAIEKEEDIKKIQSSKYVQSRTGCGDVETTKNFASCSDVDTFKLAKSFLESGRKVLYTGTPCQIAGLLSYLKKDYENLYTQDLICHGVPSPGVFREYIKFREKKAGSKIKELWLRKKTTKWSPYSVIFNFENGTQYKKIYFEDPMMKFFLRNMCLRPACHACAFKDKSRLSDITLADFWGVRKVDREIFNKKGTSLIIIHSQKGQRLFEEIRDSLVYKPVDFEKAISHNHPMTKSLHASLRRKNFMKIYKAKNMKKLVIKYGYLSI